MNQNSIISAEEKEDFLKVLNKKGFILEDKVLKVMKTNFGQRGNLDPNKVIEYKDRRVEIDLLFSFPGRFIIMEVKRTDYSWFFAKDVAKTNQINIVHDSSRGFRSHGRSTADFITIYSGIPLILDENMKLRKNNKKEVTTSSKDIHDHIIQVLNQTEAVIFTTQKNRNPNNIFFSVIVTNADLYLLKYDEGNIDARGDLVDYKSLEPINFVAYNFPYAMKWDDGKQEILHTGLNVDTEHIKTVFVVNINYLKQFMDTLLDQAVG